MTSFVPARIAQRLRRLASGKLISPHDLLVAETLLWACRAPGREAAQISFTRLAKLAGVARSTAVQAVHRLQELGILAREKTRLRVVWSLGIASRQGRNIYRWIMPATESASRPTNKAQVILERKQAHRDDVVARPVPPDTRSAELKAAFARYGRSVLGCLPPAPA